MQVVLRLWTGTGMDLGMGMACCREQGRGGRGEGGGGVAWQRHNVGAQQKNGPIAIARARNAPWRHLDWQRD